MMHGHKNLKFGIGAYAGKNKYVFKYCEQIAGEDCNVQDRWPAFESLVELKYLGKTSKK